MKSGIEDDEEARWWYVYRIRSVPHPDYVYTGATANLRRRLREHRDRRNSSTAPHAPFRLHFAAAFPSKLQALAFEAYLKSGSGHAFARRRLD